MTLEEFVRGGSFALRALRETIIFFLVLILLNTFVISFIRVNGHSMDPTLNDGEFIFINKITRFSTLKRGDIVVFHYPGDAKKNYIKRVIGLPNEDLEIINSVLYVNGTPLKEDYLPSNYKTETPDQSSFKARDGQYVLLGDNRPGSNDSRYFGYVEQRFIVGTALISVTPRFKIFSRPFYEESE